jgi:hypothetical protein
MFSHARGHGFFVSFVTVKLTFRRCSRSGSYRLARLRTNTGAEIRMTDLLGHLAGDCKLWEPRHPAMERCGAYFADLDAPPAPPDLPTEGSRRLRMVKK